MRARPRAGRPCGAPEDSLLQSGARQVAAGYVLYGSSTVFVLTIGQGVDMFVLDPSIGAFMRVERNYAFPPEQDLLRQRRQPQAFPEGYRRYLDWAQSNGYSSRYAGAMVADVHRDSAQGRRVPVSAHPKSPRRQIASDVRSQPYGHDRRTSRRQKHGRPGLRTLDIQPTAIHQRTPVILGAADQVDPFWPISRRPRSLWA